MKEQEKNSRHVYPDTACVGFKQVVSERSYGKQKQSLVYKSKRGKYNVKIKNRLINRDDNDEYVCNIASICVLPDGSILVLDFNNKRLKQLDSSYNLVSYCDLPTYPLDMCYIGNDTAIISLPLRTAIQYVNVSGSMKYLKSIELDYECSALACHGDTLFATDKFKVYTYNKDCQQRRVLYRSHDLGWLYPRIAVSDDGERVYITCQKYGLITIDNKGNHLFTLKNDVLDRSTGVCVVGDGTVLVLEYSGCVHQVDYRGEQILGTVVSKTDGIDIPRSLCYDRKICRIFVAKFSKNFISAYDLQRPSDVTNTS